MVYHVFVHKMDDSVRLLLDNVRVNKCASGGDSVTWEDMVAICRDLLAGVSLTVANAVPIVAQGQPAIALIPTVSVGSV